MPSPTVAPTALITPAPRFRPRQTGGTEIWGYWPQGTTTSTLFCSAQEIFTTSTNQFVQSKTFGGCYGTEYLANGNPLRSACTEVSTHDDSLPIATIQCVTPSASCVTQTIYASSPADPPISDIFCAQGESWSALTIFRTTSTSSTSSSSSLITTTTSSSSSTSSTSTSTSPTSSPTPPAEKSGSPSKAWISGPVIGGIALIVLAAFAVWFVRNQKRKRREAAASNDYRMSYNQNQEYTGYASPTSKPASPAQPQEMYASLPQGERHELS